MDSRKLVGWNLRQLRLKSGMSQEALAGEALDPKRDGAAMPTSHVSRIERGIENPTIDALDRLAKVLGVKTIEFFRPLKPGAKLPPTMKAGRKPKN